MKRYERLFSEVGKKYYYSIFEGSFGEGLQEQESGVKSLNNFNEAFDEFGLELDILEIIEKNNNYILFDDGEGFMVGCISTKRKPEKIVQAYLDQEGLEWY